MKSFLLHVVVLFIVFQAVSMIRERSLVAVGDDVTPKSSMLASVNHDARSIIEPGKKNLIYFFAPWCSICHASIDNVQTVYMKNPNIHVVAVALDFDDVADVEAFVSKHELGFPVLLGNHAVRSEFQVKGYPTYYIVDENGEITARSMGYSSLAGLLYRTL